MDTVAHAIARYLAGEGVKYAFGIIGGGNVALWDAIARLAQTQLVCCHHEQAAVMAASFANRTSGTHAAVALVTTGAGSTNAITGAMSAYMDSAPVVILSGNEASGHLSWGTRVLGVQGYDSAALAQGFCKHAARMTPQTWRWVLDDAFAIASRARKGPVWIDVPKDVQKATI